MGLLTGLRHPEGFHGAGVTSSYFEGWYVKLVSADRRSRWAVIPGVFLDPRGGAAFPAAYVWMQTNHFDTRDTCLTASVALIPWVHSEFRGHIVGLLHRGELHRFATYTGAVTTRLEVDDDAVRWHLRSKQGSVLELTADRPRGGLLHAPVRTEMHRRVEETLDATIHLRLLDPGGRVLLDDVGTCGGLEVHGDLPRLLASD